MLVANLLPDQALGVMLVVDQPHEIRENVRLAARPGRHPQFSQRSAWGDRWRGNA
jgi:hypothetical protein